jgi:hypothetical protein
MAHVLRWGSQRPARAYCELDRWSFDPRYTDGCCPICGWAPTGAPAAPAWLQAARRVDWELFALAGLAILLVVLGLIVAQAAGFNLPNAHQSASAIASGARTASGAR